MSKNYVYRMTVAFKNAIIEYIKKKDNVDYTIEDITIFHLSAIHNEVYALSLVEGYHNIYECRTVLDDLEQPLYVVVNEYEYKDSYSVFKDNINYTVETKDEDK